MLLTGLRGVGKTVLLNEIRRMAERMGYKTSKIEATGSKPLGPLLTPSLTEVLYSIDRVANAGDRVRRGLRVLRSFIGALQMTYHDMSFSLSVDPERGVADSGDIEIDLPAVFIALGEAALERSTAVAIFIDEVQYFSSNELGALLMAMHEVQQRQLPVVLVGAGLPILPALAGDSKSYAERLLSFPVIGALTEPDTAKALQEPAMKEGAAYEVEALHEIYVRTHGYPYFLQEWGYQSWNHARRSPIAVDDVQAAHDDVVKRLDANFFRVRFDRLSPGEKRFLRRMASLGPGPHRIADVADALNVKVTSVGPVRAKLIKKGMIYSPSYGDIAFSVPLFDEFMIRAIPDLPGDEVN
jgi:hypothetical protein